MIVAKCKILSIFYIINKLLNTNIKWVRKKRSLRLFDNTFRRRAIHPNYRCTTKNQSVDRGESVALTIVGRPCAGYRKPHWLTELLSLLSRCACLRHRHCEWRGPLSKQFVESETCIYRSSVFPRNECRTVWSDEPFSLIGRIFFHFRHHQYPGDIIMRQ